MGAVAIPIQPGKTEKWKTLMNELTGPKKREFEAMNKRMGLTKHQAYLQHTPDGNDMVIAVHEGPGDRDFLQKLARSNESFDRWFRDQLQDLHGMDFQHLPPEPELMLDTHD